MPSQPRVLSRIKNALVVPGRRERTIVSGAFRGLRMELDLQHHAQNYLGLYERELHGALSEASEGATCALDVGSADGSYVLYFLARPEVRRVIGFEPDPAARHNLRQNLRLNGFGDDARFRLVEEPVGIAGPSSLSLDDLLAEVTYPAVVKVDVEGAEAQVLRGAARLVRGGAVNWLIETHSQALEHDCLLILRAYGYAPRVIRPAWWRAILPEARPIPHNQWIVAVSPVR